MRMSQAEFIIEKFGGITALARALGHKHPTTVQGWKERGFIPSPQQDGVLEAAQAVGVDLEPADFFTGPSGRATEDETDVDQTENAA